MKLFNKLFVASSIVLEKGMSNFSKPARSLFMEIQKIDSNYYPEVGWIFRIH
jgi:hypothetical protein